jgi:osomolarity two-component system sensor histidine kinase SLN1
MSAHIEGSKETNSMSTNGVTKGSLKDQEIEFSALVGSLSMMSKVLNDVLDFNRMDSGKFESVSRPYAFHQVIQSLLVPLRLATDARGLTLDIDLDKRIDEVARHAAYEALGQQEDSIHRHMEDHPDVHGVVMGDETRLRQIITNLASNACKFTNAGGKLTITTRLIYPTPEMCEKAGPEAITETTRSRIGSMSSQENFISNDETADEDNNEGGSALKHSLVEMHNKSHLPSSHGLERIVVRIEVQDTGHGIGFEDMSDGRLFSAFIQTEQGRRQGGKGTGLGLALVRQIVKLSGGRLGLKSRVGEGSTFWVELPLGVGLKTVTSKPDTKNENGTLTKSDTPKHVGWSRRLSDPSTDALMLMDAAALKAARKEPTHERPTSALHGLMEHGGRVELTIARTDSKSSLPTAPINSIPTPRALEESMITVQSRFSRDNASKTSLPNRPPAVTGNSDSTVVGTPPSSATSPPLELSISANISPPSSPPPPLCVLVVDDDTITRMLMKRMLTRLGCRVYTAENGQVALNMLLDTTSTPSSDASRVSGPILENRSTTASVDVPPSNYAVVFLDNQMPVMSGIQLVSHLRSIGRRDFVVGVTGNALRSDQDEYIEAGVDRVLTKPVLEIDLAATLRDARERLASESGTPLSA